MSNTIHETMNWERIGQWLERLKNLMTLLGIPVLGIYFFTYHDRQMEAKDSIIELQKVQLEIAGSYSVERVLERTSAMKEYYEGTIRATADSLQVKSKTLDSLLLAFGIADTTRIRAFRNKVVLSIEDFREIAAKRAVADEISMERKQMIVKLTHALDLYKKICPLDD